MTFVEGDLNNKILRPGHEQNLVCAIIALADQYNIKPNSSTFSCDLGVLFWHSQNDLDLDVCQHVHVKFYPYLPL